MSKDDWPKRQRREAAREKVRQAGFDCLPAAACVWVFGHKGAGRYVTVDGIMAHGPEYVVEAMAHVGSEPDYECDENGEVAES